MPESLTIEIIRTAPAALWVLFAVFVYLSLQTVIKAQFGRLQTLNGPGFSMDFAASLLAEQRAHDTAAEHGQGNSSPPPTASERRAAVSRLEHAAEYLAGGRILWVDDHPDWNTPVATLFRRAGMIVETVRSTHDALGILRGQSFDLIITDMRRETEESPATAGTRLVETLAERGVATPVILFSGHVDTRRGLPQGLFAYTTGGDNLVQSVIDVMARIRFGIAMRTPVYSR